MKMILITRLESEHLQSILNECRAFAQDQHDGWGIEEQCEGGIEILENLQETEVEIPDG